MSMNTASRLHRSISFSAEEIDLDGTVHAHFVFVPGYRGNFRHDASCPEEYHGCGPEILDLVAVIEDGAGRRAATDSEHEAVTAWVLETLECVREYDSF